MRPQPGADGHGKRLERAFGLVEKRLGEADYFAGSAFTAADIVTVFSLTTMRYFLPFDLSPYPASAPIWRASPPVRRFSGRWRRAIRMELLFM